MAVLLARCALGGLLVLGLAGCTPTRGAAGSPPPSPSPSPPVAAHAPTTRANRVATRRLSARLLHAVPMPPDAHEWRHSPTAHYRHASTGIGPSDATFTRTTWWTVPLSSAAFGSWLHAHAPQGLRAARDFSGPAESEGVWEQDLAFRVPSTRTHTRGWLSFAFTPQGGRLVVRADTFIAARRARTVLVPQDVTSVTIRRTRESGTPHSRPHRTVRTVTGAAAVAALVRMVNRLPGAMTGEFVASCPESVTQRSYSMTFATPHGAYVASLPTTLCWPSLTLTRDGARVGPPLDPGRSFVETADRYLRGPS
ncbi:MAG: hypothetical protein ACTHOK_08250 [Nocardioidaceae bacterium]